MTTRSQYLNKANDCADAAKKARDPAERVALLQVSQCFILLGDYAAVRQEHGTAHRRDEQPAASMQGCQQRYQIEVQRWQMEMQRVEMLNRQRYGN